MHFSRSLLIFGVAGGLLAQAPPPTPQNPATAGPTVTLSSEPIKAPPTVPPDRVVIAVGDVKITSAQFDLIIESLPPQAQAQARGPARKDFADQLVKILVLASEARKRKLDATEAFKMQSLVQNDNLLAGLAYEQVSKEQKIGDDELKAYYEKHKSDWDEIHSRHILIRMAGSPVPVKPGQKDLTDAEALAKAQEIRKKIAGGADFGAIALAESDDTGSGAKGGDLGTTKRGQMVPAFEDAAFGLKPGELSEPIKSQFGYHVIKLDSKSNGKTFEEARPELEKRLRPEAAQKALEDIQKKSAVTLDPEFFGTAK